MINLSLASAGLFFAQRDMPMKDNKIPFFCMYSQQNTWNAMGAGCTCLFYGSIYQLEAWIIDHQQTHRESSQDLL